MKNLFLAFLVLFLFSPVCLAREGQRKSAQRSVKLRSGPAVFHPVVQELKKGIVLDVIKDGSKWVKVRTPKGSEGWVSKRVFSLPPKPKGYSALLKERGVTGVSLSISTMATKGLNSTSAMGGASMAPLLRDFLEKVPFAPADFDGFASKLRANGICEQLPDWSSEMALPVQGDPGQDELERAFGFSVAISILSDFELVTDPSIDSYVNKVGALVAAASSRYDLPWRFVVFKGDKKTAFSLPGGFVFISLSLLEDLKDEAELAGVLSHLVAHVVLGDGAERLSKLDTKKAKAGTGNDFTKRLVEQARKVIMDGMSPEEEIEADAFGATYCACVGYDPEGLASVLDRIGCFEPACSPAQLGKRIDLVHRIRKKTGAKPGARLVDRFSGSVLAVLSKGN